MGNVDLLLFEVYQSSEDSAPSTHLHTDIEETNILTLGVDQLLAFYGKEDTLGMSLG